MESQYDITTVIYATGDYRIILKDIVVPGLHAHHPGLHQESVVAYAAPSVDLAGHTNNDAYKSLMVQRQEFYLEMIRKNKGKKLLFLDCDVLIVNPFLQELSQILDTCEFAMQQNYIAGVWGIRCTDRVIDFFENFVNHIQNVDEKDRQDGFPQFELGDFIERYRTNNLIDVIELPEKYGFLTSDMVIYHAINGGRSAQAKLFTLFGAHYFWTIAKLANFNNVFCDEVWGPGDGEEELFFADRAHNTLNWFAAFPESLIPTLRAAVQDNPEATDWTGAAGLCVDQSHLLKILPTEPLHVYYAASWCDLTRTPRFVVVINMAQIIEWLGYSSAEQWSAVYAPEVK